MDGMDEEAITRPAGNVGYAEPWQLWHAEPVTPVMTQLEGLHSLMLAIMVAVCVLVAALLVYVLLRFREKRNPTPSAVSHNTLLEVLWTTVPVIILVVIAIPSFRALYFMDQSPQAADMTLKIVGRQWYWDYEYPDHGDLTFSSYILPEEELPPNGLRLLEVDRRAVVPVGATIRVVITSGDVLHAMAMPSLGIKRDAVPGRLNETWMRIDRPGVYYGQCSEICGTGHAYMPLAIEAVPADAFVAWVNALRVEAGQPPMPPAQAAAPLTANPEAAATVIPAVAGE